jgi:predicted dehydrogenase
MRPYPESLAIAGAWGYIGRKFLDAARRRRIRTIVFDPGEPPEDVDLTSTARLTTEDEFYASQADWFHLAMHPQHRQYGLDQLLGRAARGDEIAVLNEKPMAAPENPEQCAELVDRVDRTGALMLFDFPELFDPLTERILDHLRTFRDLRITDVYLCRSKDREWPGEPRNYKLMVPIQYQESVHCLAFLVFILARLDGDISAVFQQGLTVSGTAKPYQPPNPEIYPYVVDGRCHYRLALGPLSVEGQTDFKAGADMSKQRILSGTGDGRPLRIEVDYQEGRKRLLINGMDRTIDPAADSYDNVLRTLTRWRRSEPPQQLMSGIFPNPAFARVAYQLSSVLWRSCHDGTSIHLDSLDRLLAFDAGFRQAVPGLARYGG